MEIGLRAIGRSRWWWPIRVVLAGGLLVLPPLAGAYWAGKPLAPYLNLLPSTLYVEQPPFSWPVFLMLSAFILVCTLPFLYRYYSVPKVAVYKPPSRFRYPWWGWMGLVLLLVSWTMAMAHNDTPQGLQRYTFTPIWLGYILVINALSVKRVGSCLMIERPKMFLLLFIVSSAFWWFFEYLNHFVHNWYYLGPPISPLTRVVTASLAFSTVLPAVLSTVYWIATFKQFHHAYTDYWTFKVPHPRAVALLALSISTLSLFALGAWPDSTYPLIWVSPLIVLISLQALTGQQTIFSVLQHGDWRPFCLPALAGLQCGFFWELWNYGGMTPWKYNIPFVDRFHLFEMPLLGYAGYLPFGLECILIASFLGLTVHNGPQAQR
ncbi:hypothetical protein [Photobacterium proteolyticum]|nr:hypothetical protein [Photobacterium proteolyticum]